MKTTVSIRAKGKLLKQKRKIANGPRFITCAEAADILERANRLLTPKDRAQIATGIEEARRRMNNERLH